MAWRDATAVHNSLTAFQLEVTLSLSLAPSEARRAAGINRMKQLAAWRELTASARQVLIAAGPAAAGDQGGESEWDCSWR